MLAMAYEQADINAYSQLNTGEKKYKEQSGAKLIVTNLFDTFVLDKTLYTKMLIKIQQIK